MQNIPFHIAYLLTQHECVIVPDLGAFIVSSLDKKNSSQKEFLAPPENSLEFNSKIAHDDGVLANFIAKKENCSYQDACTLIDQYVDQVLYSLAEGKKERIPWVGILYSENNKILFQPDRNLSCNAPKYGLTGFSMPHLQDHHPVNLPTMEKTKTFLVEENYKTVSAPNNRKFFYYACSVVLAIVAICLIPTPLNNGLFSPTVDNDSIYVQPSVQDTINIEEIGTEITTQIPEDSIAIPVETPVVHQPETTTQIKKEIKTYYYVIVASCPTKANADRSLSEFRSKGFENAAVIYSNNRYRIYTNRFENKEEAEKFIIQFRDDNPMYSTAWMLKQKD